MNKNFILASQSPQRLALLRQIGYDPESIEPADIDEKPEKGEKPSQYVKRMALEKARHVAVKHPEKVVLASDTIIVCGTKIIQKAKSDEEQTKVMKSLSGLPPVSCNLTMKSLASNASSMKTNFFRLRKYSL